MSKKIVQKCNPTQHRLSCLISSQSFNTDPWGPRLFFFFFFINKPAKQNKRAGSKRREKNTQTAHNFYTARKQPKNCTNKPAIKQIRGTTQSITITSNPVGQTDPNIIPIRVNPVTLTPIRICQISHNTQIQLHKPISKPNTTRKSLRSVTNQQFRKSQHTNSAEKPKKYKFFFLFLSVQI